MSGEYFNGVSKCILPEHAKTRPKTWSSLTIFDRETSQSYLIVHQGMQDSRRGRLTISTTSVTTIDRVRAFRLA